MHSFIVGWGSPVGMDKVLSSVIYLRKQAKLILEKISLISQWYE